MVERDIPMLGDTPDGEMFLQSRIAELEAENERLTAQIAKATDPAYLEKKLRQIGITDDMATEALSSTGEVKVKAGYRVDAFDLKMGGKTVPLHRALEFEPHPRATNTVDAHETANVSDKPEGQQEPVDWQRVDDALVSCAGLLKTLCRDEIGDTAAAELEYVRSVITHPLETSSTSGEQAVTGPWRPIKSAPKDASLILYANKFGEIGYCYWSKAGGPFDESMWWDDQADDECCPVVWLPADTLPPLKAAMEAGR